VHDAVIGRVSDRQSTTTTTTAPSIVDCILRWFITDDECSCRVTVEELGDPRGVQRRRFLTIAPSTTTPEAVVAAVVPKAATDPDGGEETPSRASKSPARPQRGRRRHRFPNVLLDRRIGRPSPIVGVVPVVAPCFVFVIGVLTVTVRLTFALLLLLLLLMRLMIAVVLLLLLVIRAPSLRINNGDADGGSRSIYKAVPVPEFDARLEPIGRGPREAAKESLALRS
jgi:hypothetical protein